MFKTWSNLREEWLKGTSIPKDDASWALEALISSEEEFFEIERTIKNNEDAFNKIRNLKKKIKDNILLKEI